MAVTQLTPSAPISGTFNASGVSGPFTAPLPLDRTGRPVMLTSGQVRPLFSLQATFSNSAAGSLTVTKSTDGGSTFAPIMAGSRVISALSATGALNFQQLDPSWIYRIEASLTAGSVSYTIARALAYATSNIDCQVSNDPNYDLSMMPSAGYWRTYDPNAPIVYNPSPGENTAYRWPTQAQKHYETIWTPVQDADLVGMLTGYKTCYYAYTNSNGSVTIRNALAQLSIPSDASRSRGYICDPGQRREIRASAVTITALVDANNQPVASAYDPSDPTRVFTTRATLSAASYTDDNRTGIVFMLTLLEAANYQLTTTPSSKGDYPPLPNFTLLGA